MAKKSEFVAVIATIAFMVVVSGLSFLIIRKVRRYKKPPPVQLLVGRNPFDVADIKGLAFRKEDDDGTVYCFFFHGDTLDSVTVKRAGVTTKRCDPNSPIWRVWEDRFEQTRAEYKKQYIK